MCNFLVFGNWLKQNWGNDISVDVFSGGEEVLLY